MALEIVAAVDEPARERARAVRWRVFVDEQGVPATLEQDEHDESCPYVLALRDGKPIGAARYRETGNGTKLERVAVLAEHRGSGAGARMVRHVLALLPAGALLYVHAQESALGFWERMGFVAEGGAFVEAGIVHRRMVHRSG